MSRDSIRDLSTTELLRVLNEKLGLEFAKIRDTQLSSVPSATSLEPELASLEAQARDILRFISSFRNTLQPVNRLPPEIICQIARETPYHSAEDAREIVELTHVCRYWRRSIVSSPRNWTKISSRSKLLAALSLERSKATPLEISLDMDQVGELPGFPDMLKPYIENTATLKLSGLKTLEDLTQTLPEFPQSTPNLRLLDVSLLDDGPILNTSVDPFRPFPSTLKNLSLRKFPLYPSFLNVGSLTEFSLHNFAFSQPLDTILAILEGNRSLEHMTLMVGFTSSDLRKSQDRAPVSNRLRYLSVTCYNAKDINALISCIPLRRGANLQIESYDTTAGLKSILSGVPPEHLANLQSPTYMYLGERRFRLSGPSGSFSFVSIFAPEVSPFGLALLSFGKVRELHLKRTSLGALNSPSFHALEALVTEGGRVSSILPVFLASPESHPLLKTLIFLNCIIDGPNLEDLARFASNRKNTSSTRLDNVVIVNERGVLPDPDSNSIITLRENVLVYETYSSAEELVGLVPKG